MNLNWQPFRLLFTAGLNTKVDPKSLEPPELADLQNGVFFPGGIEKRNGYLALGTRIATSGTATVHYEDAWGLSTRSDELVLFAGSKAYGYSSSGDKWLDRGTIQLVKPDIETISSTVTDQTYGDYASALGVTVSAWIDSRGGVRYSVQDESTGAYFQFDRLLSSTGIKPRCVAVDGFLHILYMEIATNRLLSKVISPANVLSSLERASILVTEDIPNNATASYDVMPTLSKAVIAWHTSSNTVRVGYLNKGGSLGSLSTGSVTPITISEACSGPIAVAWNPANNDVFLSWAASATGIRAAFLSQTLSVLGSGAAFTLHSTIATIDNLAACWEPQAQEDGSYRVQAYFHCDAADTFNHYVLRRFASYTDFASTPEDSSTVTTWRHSGLATRAFPHGDYTYVTVSYQSEFENQLFTYRQDGFIAGRHLPVTSEGHRGFPLPQVESVDEDTRRFCAIFRNRLVTDDDAEPDFSEKGLKLITLDFSTDQAPITAQVGKSLYAPAACLYTYDGAGFTENNFFLPPEGITASGIAGGLLTTSGTTYLYRAHWGANNAQGELVLGPGYEINVVMNAPYRTASFRVPTLQHTLRDNARLVMFRNEGDGDPAALYRVDDPSNPTFNDPTVDYITFEDALPDTSILDNEGDPEDVEIQSRAPEGFKILVASKGRMFAAGFENPNQISYSKFSAYGQEASFGREFYMELPEEGGPITAMGVMDNGILVAFKRDSIYVISGDGPNNTGLGGDFSMPARLNTDVGCVNQASVVACKDGLLFKPEHTNVKLLDRSFNVIDIGDRVELYSGQTITKSTLVPESNHVRLLTNDGRTLVWDYSVNLQGLGPGQWSTFTNHEGVDAVYLNGRYHYLANNGELRKEEPGHFLDNSSRYSLLIRTGHLHPQGLQTRFKTKWAKVLGTHRSIHRFLRVKAAYNYKEGFEKTWNFDPSLALDSEGYGGVCDVELWLPAFGDEPFGEGPYGGDTSCPAGYGDGPYGGIDNTLYEFRWKPARHNRGRIQAIQFQFEDVLGDNPGESYSLTELVVDMGWLPGTPKLGSTKTL